MKIMLLYLLLQIASISQAQDTTGSHYIMNCKVPSGSTSPSPDEFGCRDFECESGYFKIELNTFTAAVPGIFEAPRSLSYACVSRCSSRGTHYPNLIDRTCERCDYPCKQCNQGVCTTPCSFPSEHCFVAVPSCVQSEDQFEDEGNCEIGCPAGTYPNISNKACDLCFPGSPLDGKCTRCNGPTPNDCTGCQPGFYLEFNSEAVNYGKCVKKNPNPPSLHYELLVSHRALDRNLPINEKLREGSEDSPFTDIRSALNKADEIAAPFVSSEVTIVIYLSKGPHFITLTDQFYLAREHSELYEQNYKLIIKPLYSDNGLDITNPQLIVGHGEKVKIYNKIGAYFSIQVPLFLEVQNIVFDSLDSLAKWSPSCLSQHSQTCSLDTLNKVVSDTDAQSECGCAAPPDHSLNNCIADTGTAFFKLGYYSPQVSLPHPRELVITGCSFLNFFHPFNAIVGLQDGASRVTITDTNFQRFSSCGAVVKNTAMQPEIKERKTGNGNNFTEHPEDRAVFKLQIEDNGSLEPDFPSCPKKSNKRYGQECQYLIIKECHFHDFDFFFKTEHSLTGSPNSKGVGFRMNDFYNHRAQIVHLVNYNGFVRISDSSFKNIKHHRPQCYYDELSNSFPVNIDEEFSLFTTFYMTEYLKVENPIIVVKQNHGFWFNRNRVEESSGLKGFLYLTVRPNAQRPNLIEDNEFIGVAGFYGSAVIHATLVENSFEFNSPDYEATCGGLTLRGNLFQGSVSCNAKSPTVRIDCTDDISDKDYLDYTFQNKDLPDWETNVSKLLEETVTIGFNGYVSRELSIRSVVLQDNIFTKSHRGEAAEEIYIHHVPSVVVKGTQISLSSSFAFITDQFTASFAQTELLHDFKSSQIGEPGSLI